MELIFDLDGTLWNTALVCVNAWNQAIQNKAINRQPITLDDINSMMGLTTEEMRLKYFSALPFDQGHELLQECFRQEVLMIRSTKNLTYPHVLECLKELKKRARLFIVSNCEEDYLNLFLEVSQTGNLFDGVDCYGRTKVHKGETIKLLMNRHHITNAIYVGDTPHDQKAAQFANIPFYFLRYGFGRVENADQSFDDFRDFFLHIVNVNRDG